MKAVKKHSPLLILGLLLLGVCMRMPITAIPSVVKEIAHTFAVAPTSLGILTTIPLLCFGLLSAVVFIVLVALAYMAIRRFFMK